MNYYGCILIIATISISCKTDKKEQSSDPILTEISANNIIEVTAKDFVFAVEDSIPSGWSTFKMKNNGMMEHFFFLTKLPDTIVFDDYVNGVGAAFGKSWIAYKHGEVDKAGAYGILGANLPVWYPNAVAMGGIGMISGGQTGTTTLKLVPGNYVMECYIKTENGQFHSELGMINPITVTEEITTMEAPEANAEINLSNEALEVKGTLRTGENRIAVKFNEHPEIGLGNDIHLIKVTDSTKMEDVTQWMDWLEIGGLTSPGPATFLGGTHEMPVGYTAYFSCDLEPGTYAFVAETPLGRYQLVTVE